jgi:hypothetical protein
MSRSRVDRRASAVAAGTVAYLAAIGLVAAATAGAFFGAGYVLLPQPQPERHAAVPARSDPMSAAAIVVHPSEPATAAATPVPPPKAAPATAAPVHDTAADKPAAPQSAAPPNATPAEPSIALSPTEIARLLREGETAFRTGDVDSARVFFRHAAEAGDAQAALRMGTTFDPALLARGRLRNRFADRTEARLWYLRAFDMGAADAPNRLAHLAREAAR